MQLVIDISETLKGIADDEDIKTFSHIMWQAILMDAIKNGTPLPKYHGRLKDVDVFLSKVKADREHSAYLRSWTADDVLGALDNSYAPTIIEADGEV